MEKDADQLLDSIEAPADLRRLPLQALPRVCAELRRTIIREMASNPGHFASSLGVVELTVALHYTLDTPRDRVVWDVGHQAAGHKILTGRRRAFATYRHLGGLRPFPSPDESEYDTFTCGHASNSISAALGMAVAAHRLGQEERHVVAVIGDGSMSGGLAFEGLNNASATPNNLLIILNDNNMSIDHCVGGMKDYLHQLHTSRLYNTWRFRLSRQLTRWGLLDERRCLRIMRFNNSLKSLLNNQQNVFEGMNIRYFGPCNGHDVVGLVNTLRQIMDMRGPKLLHVHTVKGKGFRPAEENPTLFHAPGKYDPLTGERPKPSAEGGAPLFQDVFGHTALELARANPRIVAVTPAMATGCGLAPMMREMPGRVFDVGIAEGHAVTFSAGLAKEGMTPLCNIYSSFSQRAYDNIIHDVALGRLGVVLCLDRAGLVGQDGPTHHGAFDLAALRPVPGLTIASPMDECELRLMMYTAQLPGKGPFVIRYPRGRGVRPDWECPLRELPVGKGRRLRQGGDVAVLSLGPLGNTVARALDELERRGTRAAHYDMRFLKPLDSGLLDEVGRTYRRVVTVEDGARSGGLGSAVLEFMSERGLTPRVRRLGLPDAFMEHGAPEELYRIAGLDDRAVMEAVTKDWEDRP